MRQLQAIQHHLAQPFEVSFCTIITIYSYKLISIDCTHSLISPRRHADFYFNSQFLPSFSSSPSISPISFKLETSTAFIHFHTYPAPSRKHSNNHSTSFHISSPPQRAQHTISNHPIITMSEPQIGIVGTIEFNGQKYDFTHLVSDLGDLCTFPASEGPRSIVTGSDEEQKAKYIATYAKTDEYVNNLLVENSIKHIALRLLH